MFRKVISILLLGSILASAANFIFPFASYYTNYHYFSTVACVHKLNPDMHCNGSCQLKRMLKKEQKDSAANNSKAKVDHSIRKDFYYSNVCSYLIPPLSKGQIRQPVDDDISSLFFESPPSPPPQFA